jgi:hypothetical protein
MADEPNIRTNLIQILEDINEILDTKLNVYFLVGTEELRSYQQEILDRSGEITVHEFMLLTFLDNAGYSEDYDILSEIERSPLNHIDFLYRAYEAVLPR